MFSLKFSEVLKILEKRCGRLKPLRLCVTIAAYAFILIFLKTHWVRSWEIWSKTNTLCQTIVNACVQVAICFLGGFFTGKYEILQLHSKSHSFFYIEIQNSTVVLKLPQRNTKFRIVPFVLWLRNTKFLEIF